MRNLDLNQKVLALDVPDRKSLNVIGDRESVITTLAEFILANRKLNHVLEKNPVLYEMTDFFVFKKVQNNFNVRAYADAAYAKGEISDIHCKVIHEEY